MQLVHWTDSGYVRVHNLRHKLACADVYEIYWVKSCPIVVFAYVTTNNCKGLGWILHQKIIITAE